MSLRYSIILVAALGLCSCSSQRETTTIAEPDHFIFGSGGGFTGKYTEYKIYDSGMIDEMDFKKEAWVPYAEVDPSEVKPFFIDLNELDLLAFKYDHPAT